jgi:hypothetical protein
MDVAAAFAPSKLPRLPMFAIAATVALAARKPGVDAVPVKRPFWTDGTRPRVRQSVRVDSYRAASRSGALGVTTAGRTPVPTDEKAKQLTPPVNTPHS